jgi:hypothetical protein
MMNDIAREEDEWQRKATSAAIAAARKIVLGNPSLKVAHVGRLNDYEWGWIVTAAIFAWIQTRCEQAIAEGIDQEQAVRMSGLTSSPCDVAPIKSMLPQLADTAGIDWALPLNAWSQETMIGFLLLALELSRKAELPRDQAAGTIVRQSTKEDWDQEGDPIPFETTQE